MIQEILTDDKNFLILAYTLMFLWIVFVLVVGVGLTKKYKRAKYFDTVIYAIATVFFFLINIWNPTFKGIVFNILYFIIFFLSIKYIRNGDNSKAKFDVEELNYSIMDTILEGEENIEFEEKIPTKSLLIRTFIWGVLLYLGSYLLIIYWPEIELKIRGISFLTAFLKDRRLEIYAWFSFSYFVLQFLFGFIRKVLELNSRFHKAQLGKNCE